MRCRVRPGAYRRTRWISPSAGNRRQGWLWSRHLDLWNKYLRASAGAPPCAIGGRREIFAWISFLYWL